MRAALAVVDVVGKRQARARDVVDILQRNLDINAVCSFST
jgi:hypothetical protein